MIYAQIRTLSIAWIRPPLSRVFFKNFANLLKIVKVTLVHFFDIALFRCCALVKNHVYIEFFFEPSVGFRSAQNVVVFHVVLY